MTSFVPIKRQGKERRQDQESGQSFVKNSLTREEDLPGSQTRKVTTQRAQQHLFRIGSANDEAGNEGIIAWANTWPGR